MVTLCHCESGAYAKSFMYINSFNPSGNPMSVLLVLFLILQRRKVQMRKREKHLVSFINVLMD